jgi:hypothetical protein
MNNYSEDTHSNINEVPPYNNNNNQTTPIESTPTYKTVISNISIHTTYIACYPYIPLLSSNIRNKYKHFIFILWYHKHFYPKHNKSLNIKAQTSFNKRFNYI